MDSSEILIKFREFLSTNGFSIENVERCILNINKIRMYSKELADAIITSPADAIPYIEEELKHENGIDRIGFVGSLGFNSVGPRTLNSKFLGKLVSVEGIVTSCSLIRPKIKNSVHFCSGKNVFYEKEYRDSTMITKLPPTNTVYPQKDMDGNKITTEFGLSTYSDFQTIVLQEMPERSPPGQLPRSIEVVLSDDLVDSTKPGSRVTIFGIYKSMVYGNQQFPNKFKTVLIANHILKDTKESEIEDLIPSSFTKFATSDERFRLIAPTIYGHDMIKKAVCLLLVGGNEMVMENGARIRGDINMLLIGDPSTAKSQILRFVMDFVPLSVATTGRGSTGVGLTAAVVKDSDTGERRLEAGAMVLADKGVVCIDEFDKMNDLDRVAIHEVMEQQTVTIAKAGIHTTLNARCTVLAAANPIFGSYDVKKTPQENISLPESLMTRFDLVFVVLDRPDKVSDTKISKHVLRMHTEMNEDDTSNSVFREYIGYAKKMRPVLSNKASSMISSEYVRLRKGKNDKSLVVNITPRILETLIRLSIANAKLRLSETVEEIDAKEAIEMLSYSNSKKKERNVKNGDKKIEKKMKIGRKDEVVDGIWRWRSENSSEHVCKIEELSRFLEISITEIEEVVKQLSEDSVLIYDDKTIYFID